MNYHVMFPKAWRGIIKSASVCVAALAVMGLVISCGGSDNAPRKTASTQAGANTLRLNLTWPEGYSYDPATREITPPSSQYSQTLPSYVTRVTLTIEGEGMETVVLEVPLDTMKVEITAPPGIRTMTLLVETNIPGLSFTSSQMIYMPPGGIAALGFDLEINAPPQDVSVTASVTTTYKNTPVTISVYADELDPEDESAVTWDGGGGNVSRSGNPYGREFNWSVSWSASRSGRYTICATIDDHKGGVVRECVTVTVVNRPPVMNGVTADNTAPSVGATVNLSCSASDPDGDSLTYAWSDGAGWTAIGATAQYTVTQSGAITLTCSVSDGDGGTASGSVTLNNSTGAPGVPAGPTANPGDTEVTVSWNPVSGASSYNIYWDTTSGTGTGGTKITGVTSPYVHTGLTNGTTYYYVVTAVTSGVESAPSSEASAVPGAPSGLAASPGDAQVTLSWNAFPGALSYNLYWDTLSGVTTSSNKITGAASPYVHASLTNGTTYYYKISAVTSSGEGPLSAEVSATPQTCGDFQVDTTADTVDNNIGDGFCADGTSACSLRAAIQEANSLAGAQTICVPGGTYTLTIPGTLEDAAATGDLDITDDLTINGAGAKSTFIDGGLIDRVLHSIGATLQVSGVTIQNGKIICWDGQFGAGIAVAGGSVTITYSTISNNTVSCGSVGNSGGISCSWCTLLIQDSAISNNSAYGPDWSVGGGILKTGSGTLTISNSTISGNHADRYGGGIYTNSFTATITNSTVTNNSAGWGSGSGIALRNAGGGATVNLKNTIVANQASGTDCAILILGSFVDNGNNLDSDNTCNLNQPTSLPGTNPQLNILADYGGTTPTHALLAGSPAINAGDNGACPATDQRGVSRSDGACDMGAYEY